MFVVVVMTFVMRSVEREQFNGVSDGTVAFTHWKKTKELNTVCGNSDMVYSSNDDNRWLW